MRFGILCTGYLFQQWQAEVILTLMQRGHQPVLLILDNRPALPESFFKRQFARRKHLLFSYLENRFFSPPSRKPTSLEIDLKDVPAIRCVADTKGFSNYFAEEDIQAVRGYQADFILRFAFGIIRGGMLEAARFGIWSFHHGDEEKYRGGPAGFWEIFRDDPVNGLILQQLTSRLDGGIILKKGFLKTIRHSWRENLEQLYKTSTTWPAMVADEISRAEKAGETFSSAGSESKAPVYHLPGNFQMVLFLFKLLKNRILFYYQTWLLIEKWNIGIIRQPIENVALRKPENTPAEIEWFPEQPEGRYLADPFGMKFRDVGLIAAENFDYRQMRGFITFFRKEGSGYREVVNDERFRFPAGFHYSYPYIFRYGSECYCIPESWESGKVTLFRFFDDLTGIGEVATLVDGVDAVDPTLVFHQQIFWLFFTQRRHSNTHLYLFFSDKIAGPYLAHPQNPVKIDIRSARPAGTPFYCENLLFRPGQDCSSAYGSRIAINRILKITPEEYLEETIHYFEPDPGGKYNKGLHTLSDFGDETLADGKYLRPDLRFLFRQIIHYLKKRVP